MLGGADFGGGVWDLLARGPDAAIGERALIAAAIGPVWEANHVWLIFVVTALFAAFPTAFAALGVALYLPFGIAIAGIVMRGAAFAFRAYGEPDTGWQRAWTRVFGIASLVTPVVLGMCAAAIASGRIRVHDDIVRADLVGAWTGPLSWIAGAAGARDVRVSGGDIPDRRGGSARGRRARASVPSSGARRRARRRERSPASGF